MVTQGLWPIEAMATTIFSPAKATSAGSAGLEKLDSEWSASSNISAARL